MRTILLALLVAAPLCADDFSYVYVPAGEGEHVSISRGDLDQVLRLRKQLSGTYLWAKTGRAEYVIRSAAVLREVEEAYEPLRKLQPHQEALRAKMRAVEERERRLEREADALTDSEKRLTSAERARLDKLRTGLHAIRKELEPLESAERRLDQQEEAREKVFDAELQRIVRRAIRNGTAQKLR